MLDHQDVIQLTFKNRASGLASHTLKLPGNDTNKPLDQARSAKRPDFTNHGLQTQRPERPLRSCSYRCRRLHWSASNRLALFDTRTTGLDGEHAQLRVCKPQTVPQAIDGHFGDAIRSKLSAKVLMCGA